MRSHNGRACSGMRANTHIQDRKPRRGCAQGSELSECGVRCDRIQVDQQRTNTAVGTKRAHTLVCTRTHMHVHSCDWIEGPARAHTHATQRAHRTPDSGSVTSRGRVASSRVASRRCLLASPCLASPRLASPRFVSPRLASPLSPPSLWWWWTVALSVGNDMGVMWATCGLVARAWLVGWDLGVVKRVGVMMGVAHRALLRSPHLLTEHPQLGCSTCFSFAAMAVLETCGFVGSGETWV